MPAKTKKKKPARKKTAKRGVKRAAKKAIKKRAKRTTRKVVKRRVKKVAKKSAKKSARKTVKRAAKPRTSIKRVAAPKPTAPEPAPVKPPVTKPVAFALDAPGAWEVGVAGTFNSWEPRAMVKDPEGRWRLTLDLVAGSYQYRFRVDNEWRDDPNNPNRQPNEFGGYNSVVTVS